MTKAAILIGMGLVTRPLHLSQKGAAFIGGFEGLVMHPYNDAAGYATIGYGHLIHYSPVTDADRQHYRNFTKAEAIRLLQTDAEKCAQAVVPIKPMILSQTRFDALVSLAFNCGPGVLDPGRSMGDAVRRLGRRGAADAFLLYDVAGGRVLTGLKRRREAERRLWLTGQYS